MNIIDYLKKWQPLSDLILVQPDIKSQKTKSGVVLAQQSHGEEKAQTGTVLAIGYGRLPESGIERQPITVKVGDKVLFRRHAGDDLMIDENQEIYEGHMEAREGLIPVKILIEDAILIILP